MELSTSASAAIAHPKKMDTGGEDAWLNKPSIRVWGVFDGVGGWNEIGVDSGLFSRHLAATTCTACAKIDAGKSQQKSGLTAMELRRALSEALSEVKEPGSTTACLLSIAPTGEVCDSYY